MNITKSLSLKNLSVNLDADLDGFQEEFEQQELRQRMRRATSRAERREHHLAKKNAAPNIGDLIAPGVPNDSRLVMHTSSWDYVIGSQL